MNLTLNETLGFAPTNDYTVIDAMKNYCHNYINIAPKVLLGLIIFFIVAEIVEYIYPKIPLTKISHVALGFFAIWYFLINFWYHPIIEWIIIFLFLVILALIIKKNYSKIKNFINKQDIP